MSNRFEPAVASNFENYILGKAGGYVFAGQYEKDNLTWALYVQDGAREPAERETKLQKDGGGGWQDLIAKHPAISIATKTLTRPGFSSAFGGGSTRGGFVRGGHTYWYWDPTYVDVGIIELHGGERRHPAASVALKVLKTFNDVEKRERGGMEPVYPDSYAAYDEGETRIEQLRAGLKALCDKGELQCLSYPYQRYFSDPTVPRTLFYRTGGRDGNSIKIVAYFDEGDRGIKVNYEQAKALLPRDMKALLPADVQQQIGYRAEASR